QDLAVKRFGQRFDIIRLMLVGSAVTQPGHQAGKSPSRPGPGSMVKSNRLLPPLIYIQQQNDLP
ncbi:MAG: hypothetical protein ACRDC7_17010, partial [Aeromonas veronii]